MFQRKVSLIEQPFVPASSFLPSDKILSKSKLREKGFITVWENRFHHRGPGVYSGRSMSKALSTVSYWMDHRAPNGGARESTQGAKGICNPIGGTTLWANQYPGALDSSRICIKRWPSRPSTERGPLDLQTLYAPVQGNARAKKGEWVGRGVVGRVWGTFGIALEM